MGKLLKWLVIGVVVLILLVVLAFAGLATFVDLNDHKPTIIELVKKNTGRDLTIEGELSWQLWPPIGISIGKTQLNNTPAFGGQEMLRLDQMVVDIQVLPLLSKTVIIDEIRVDGFYFHRITNEQGETNLDDLMAKGQDQPATDDADQTDPSTPPESSEKTGSPLADIQLGKGISITNAVVIDENLATGTRQQLNLVNFAIGQFAFDQWFDFTFEIKAELSQPSLLATATWQSQLKVNQAMDHIQLQEGLMLVNAEGEALPKPVTLRLNTAIDVSLSEEKLVAEPLQLQLNQLTFTAPLTITGLTTSPQVATQVSLTPFNAKQLLAELGIILETTDEQVLTKVGMDSSLNFDVGKSRLSLPELTIVLDDTRISGEAAVQLGEILESQFKLAIDDINVDRYLPPPAAEATEAPAKSEKEETPGEQAPPPDLNFLKTLDVEGKATVGHLQVSKVELDNISLDLLIREGKLRIKPFSADIYQGSVRTDLVLNANPEVPEFQVKQSISSVQVGPLLKAVADLDILIGATELTASISGRSLDPVTIQETLNGKGNFQFKDGAVKGINVSQLIRDGLAMLGMDSGDAETTADQPKKTDFSELTGSFTIVNGLINNPDLKAYSPLLRINGKGDINLPGQNLNYQTKITVVGTLEGQGGKDTVDLGGLTIPLLIKGPFAEPDIKLDMAGAMQGATKDKAKAVVKEQTKKLEEKGKKLEKKAKEKFGKELKGLEGLF